MTHSRSFFRGAAAGLLLAQASWAFSEADPVYTKLRAARPEGSGVAVEHLTIERDVFRFRFDKGAFQMLAPVDGRVAGAVFVGEGSWELHPASAEERRHLALVTGEKGLEVLTDRFDSLVLLFTDDTEREIRRGGSEPGPAPARAAEVWESFRRIQRKDLQTNLQIRLLADLLRKNDPKAGMFLAGVDGKKLPSALAVVDPSGLDWFAPNTHPGREDSAFWVIPQADAGFWYLARRKRQDDEPPATPFPGADAEHYVIEATILENSRLQGWTTIRLKAGAGDWRVLPIQLLDKLRIQEASVALADAETWTPIAFIQEKADEDGDAAVVLPAAPPRGGLLRVRLRYEGKDVLRDMGDGTFAVGARESWYPNLGGFRDPATFDLTYRVPRGTQVVSVGERLSDRTEGNSQVSVWKPERPIRVAGFNYGKFRKLDNDDRESGVKIEVFTSPGTPDLIREINMALQSRGAGGRGSILPGELDGPFYSPPNEAGLQSIQLDSEGFAQSAMADGVNSARVCTAYFGPLADKHVAITQQAEWFFGQSWPSLVFLPYLAALDGTTRHALGFTDANDFVDLVGPHEFAHQWWGHLVGFDSYRDQWLSEGFAEFSAALVLQRTAGGRRFNLFWEKARRWILAKPRGSAVGNADAGPITLGTRLATRRSPAAYQALVYSKGAYVLHMLRMMMRDPQHPAPDAPFIAMMKDFAATFAGMNASTADFQKIVEAHMVPAMNATRDGKMDWFFRQWVHGTEIPKFVAKLDIQAAAAGEYRIQGTLAQEGVSPVFRVLLPLYLEFDKTEVQRMGVIPLVGTTSVPIDVTIKLPKKPRRVVLNAFHDVLARD